MRDVRKHPARGRSDLVAAFSTAAAGERCEMSHKQGEEGRTDVTEDEAEQRRARRESGTDRADREAAAWREDTGYRPSANQNRDEPMPASHHAPRGQEAEASSEQDATDEVQARPSTRARERDGR